MLFWIFVILLVLGLLLQLSSWACIDNVGQFMAFFSMWGVIIGLPVLILNYIGVDADIASYQAKYDSLVYQFENDVYENDNDVGKQQLYSDITEWNIDLAKKKVLQRHFWLGVFIPNIYDQFEYIELK